MSVPSNTDDTARELLVAYLDGELSPEEARAVERRISEDAELRQEMQALEKAWNALDELPSTSVDEVFSRTTIEMVAVEAEREVEQLTAAMPVVRRRRGWRTAALGAAAVVLGFVAIRSVATAPDRQLVRDLPVLWGIEPLSQNADARFLTLLAERQPEFVHWHSACKTEEEAEVWTAISTETASQRYSRLSELPQEQRDRLQTAERQFHALSESKQQSLRRRYATLELADDPAQLQLAAMAYASWVASLTPNTQLELRQLDDPAARVERVAELWREEQDRARRNLSTNDEQALLAAVREAAQRPGLERLIEDLKQARDQRLDAWERRDDADSDARWIQRVREFSARFDRVIETRPALRVALAPQVAYEGRRHGGRPWPGIPEELRSQAQDEWQAIEEQLIDSLSRQVRKGLQDDSPERRAARLRQWIVEIASAEINPTGMEAFFTSDALTDAERMELLALPRDQMDERIRRLYVERELGGVDPRTLDNMARVLGDRPGPPPDGRRPRRDDDRDSRRDESF